MFYLILYRSGSPPHSFGASVFQTGCSRGGPNLSTHRSPGSSAKGSDEPQGDLQWILHLSKRCWWRGKGFQDPNAVVHLGSVLVCSRHHKKEVPKFGQRVKRLLGDSTSFATAPLVDCSISIPPSKSAPAPEHPTPHTQNANQKIKTTVCAPRTISQVSAKSLLCQNPRPLCLDAKIAYGRHLLTPPKGKCIVGFNTKNLMCGCLGGSAKALATHSASNNKSPGEERKRPKSVQLGIQYQRQQPTNAQRRPEDLESSSPPKASTVYKKQRLNSPDDSG